MKRDINEIVKEMKRSFRLKMNGVASQSMRQMGVDYKVNWGWSLTDLRKMAAEYGKDYDLAIALWKENIRECKILATLIMPPEKMLPEVADVWIEQIHSQDMAEMVSFNLFQYLSFAPVLAYECMASDDKIKQICAYQVLARLFMKGQEPNERGINEFLDQVSVALQHKDMGVRHAAMNSVIRFSEMNDVYKNMAEKALNLSL